MIHGLISIGTNSTRALVAQFDPGPRVLLRRSTGTRIGEGLEDTGQLDAAAIARTLEAVGQHVRAVRELTDDIEVIATSALRRAKNAAAFAEEIYAITGAALQIISGDEEARCSYAGAISGLPQGGSYGVLDVGGGSTEYAVAAAHVSCEIGAVRLTERFPTLRDASTKELRPARAAARDALAPLRSFGRVDRLVFVGGSATTACAVARGSVWSQETYVAMERATLRNLAASLASLPLEQRKAMPGMVAQRADISLAGVLILDQAFAALGHKRAVVSTNDLLLGYLLRHER